MESFSPLTLRTIFADEPLRPVHQLSMWRTWPFESEAIPLISQAHSKALIPKPSGELGRPGRNGYSLSAALGWEMLVYKKVQVCNFQRRDNSSQTTSILKDPHQGGSELYPQERRPIQCPGS